MNQPIDYTGISILLAAVGVLVSSLVSTIITLMTYIAGARRDEKLESIKVMVDGQSHALNAITAKSSFAEGVKSETDRH
jgi:hypothetical protein